MLPLAVLSLTLLRYSQFQSPSPQPPVQIEQGRVLDVELELRASAAPSWSPVLHLLDQSVPCHRRPIDPERKRPEGSEDWACLAGIPADAETGVAPIYLDEPQAVVIASVTVAAVPYPTEPLHLTPALKKLEDSPEQVKLIRGTLRTESPDRMWKDFAEPVRGKVESAYGERRTVDGRLLKEYHRGTDLAAPLGSPVRCAADGKVLLTGAYPEEGNMVLVDHGQGVVTAYLHMSKILARKGRAVARGETLGLAGSTGLSNSSHVHFGVYIHGTPVDPLIWLKESRGF